MGKQATMVSRWALGLAALLLTGAAPAPREAEAVSSVIVQGADLAAAASAVRAVGGEATHELGVIRAVAARLTAAQREKLASVAGLRLYGDASVRTASQTALTLLSSGDSYLREDDDDANYGNDIDLRLKADSDKRRRAVIRFDLSAVPPSSIVTSATLRVYLTRKKDGVTVHVHRLSEDWAEGTGGTGAGVDWATRDGAVAWGTSGTSFDPAAEGSFPSDDTDVYREVDLTSLAQAWVDATVPNYGVILDPQGSNGETKIASREDVGFAPELVLSYMAVPYSDFPTLIGADSLHAQGIDGSGITVAVVDTGYWSHPALDTNSNGAARVLAQYDAISDQMDPIGTDTDTFGHGTHLTSVMLSSATDAGGQYNGIAPGADLVSVKAFSNGTGSYSDVIRGIDWAVTHQAAYGIGVMNLSFSAAPFSHYWDDPLNQAVMAAWEAGIVVVASAGNTGPDPMTVGVPGNVPYVITVGAMSDAVTPGVAGDDYLASFSSTGPTVEGFVKPEVVAPGGHLLGLMEATATIAQARPEYQLGGNYFTMSGTSQSAALVSGVVALILDDDPTLTPDGVKCRLLASARAALDGGGDLAYSIFQQGAGMVHAYDAVYSTASACANLSLDVAADLAGTAHFGGPARRDTITGFYYHADEIGYEWDGTFFAGGFPFIEGGGFPFIEGGGFPFIEGGGFPFIEGGGFPFIEGSVAVSGLDWLVEYPWTTTPHVWSAGLTETMSVNQWVPQE